jgi:uncharacterized protein YggE
MEKTGKNSFVMGLFGGVIFLGVLYFFPWKDITWGRILLGNEGVVTVTGYAEADQKNQVAQFSAGVNAINDSKELAVNEVNRKMAEVLKSVKSLGIDPVDIKTQQVNVYQMQENVSPDVMGGRVKLGQWNASNTIEITLRDVNKASQLADTLTVSGATNVYGPNFQLDSSKKAGDSLLEAAVADARQKASLMARSGGTTLGRVISITEGGQAPSAYPLTMRAESAKMDLGTPTPVEVGTTTVTKTVTVVWSLK